MRTRAALVSGIAAVALVACSPYRPLETGSVRGGFKDQQIAPGLFGILVKSDVSLWTNGDAVRETWSRRARELCGGDYTELASEDGDQELEPATGGALRDHVDNRIGFALCAHSPLSREAALREIDRVGLLPRGYRAPPQ